MSVHLNTGSLGINLGYKTEIKVDLEKKLVLQERVDIADSPVFDKIFAYSYNEPQRKEYVRRAMQISSVGTTPFETLGRYYKRAEKQYGRYYSIFYTFTTTYDSLNESVKFPASIHAAVRWMNYYSVVDLVFAGPRLVTNITDFVRKTTIYARVSALFSAISEVIGIALQISFIIDTAKELGYLAQNAFARMPDTSKLYLPYYSIFLYQSVDQWTCLQSCYSPFRNAKDMKEKLEYVAKNGNAIQSTLYLSKKLKLSVNAARLITEAEKGVININAEKFLQDLKHRFFVRQILDTSYCLINLASVVVMLIPAHSIVNTVYAISNISSIVFTIVDNKKILN